MAVQKPLYHLATARSWQQLRQRLRLYFTDGCPPVALDSDEGQRLMLANAAAMNYGFAFRMATYAGAAAAGGRDASAARPGRLVVDSPHNSIYEEEVGGERAVVHRHNSCRAYPADLMPAGTTFAQTGQAVLLPGTHRTSSLPRGGRRARARRACTRPATAPARSSTSSPSAGLSGADPQGRSTLRFRYDDAAPTEAPHLDDDGVNAALSVLSAHRIVRPGGADAPVRRPALVPTSGKRSHMRIDEAFRR